VIKKIGFVLIGVAFLSLATWLGILSVENPAIVPWFGIASLLLGPSGFAFIGYAFKSDDDVILKKLSKIPQIEKLFEEAKSQEQKIEALEEERIRLTEIIQYEARRQTLESKKETLESEGVRLLQSLKSVGDELSRLEVEVIESGKEDDIDLLRTRLRESKKEEIAFYIGSKEYVFDSGKLRNNPMGEVLLGYLMLLSAIQKAFRELFTRS